jgi:hypothetical protein
MVPPVVVEAGRVLLLPVLSPSMSFCQSSLLHPFPLLHISHSLFFCVLPATISQSWQYLIAATRKTQVLFPSGNAQPLTNR